MSDSRAAKSGFAAEAQKKINSKYSEESAAEVMQWIKLVSGESFDVSGQLDNVHEVLKDGSTLCKLANKLKPGSVKKIQTSTMAFKCMENINSFLMAAKDLGVPTEETFQTVDLWEKQNMHAVIICLQSLGRKAANYGQPSIGPKEAEKNVRQFSDEQLKQGSSVVSLQYGSNKGATQSGISFGNTRHM
ncbi:Transgelin [Chamberlinius hualienensis]